MIQHQTNDITFSRTFFALSAIPDPVIIDITSFNTINSIYVPMHAGNGVI